MKWTRSARAEMEKIGYSLEWLEAINGYLACVFDKMLVQNSSIVYWLNDSEKVGHTFVRYALPMTWDFSEVVMPNEVPGSYQFCLDRVLSCMETVLRAQTAGASSCAILCQSATNPINQKADTIITDPPYYDAIPLEKHRNIR